VTCHVTAMSRASSSSLKEKEKEIQKKRNIKSRKIDKRKRKKLVLKHSITGKGGEEREILNNRTI